MLKTGRSLDLAVIPNDLAPRSHRQSKTLMEAESLELLLPKKDVDIQGIVEERFGYDPSQDKRRRRGIINKRYKGRKLLQNRLEE